MNKSQAYKALAIYQLQTGLSTSEVNVWLMENDPITLCKALGLYTKTVNRNVPEYIKEITRCIKADEYIPAIKALRTETRGSLTGTKRALDYFCNKINWAEMCNDSRSVYVNYLEKYKHLMG